MFVLLSIIVSLACNCYAAYENCDYQKPMVAGQTYYIYDVGTFGASASCRWNATAPENYVIKMNCLINITNSGRCTKDRATVSTTGDPELRDGKVYCGSGSFSVSSFDNKMLITLTSDSESRGGLFSCSLTISEVPCKCGWRKGSRIVGGREAQPNEFVMMAALLDSTFPTDPTIFCGATIISYYYLVTAAHCILGRSTNNTIARLGEHDVTKSNETIYTHDRNIDFMTIHESFSVQTQQNDIGLIKLTESILFSPGVGPTCLPFEFTNLDYPAIIPWIPTVVTVPGWGTTSYGGSTSNVLKKTDLYVQTNATCVYYYPGKIGSKQFCAYNYETDSCQNDSGGPLFYYDPFRWVWKNLGITSYGGIGCATSKPGVNTRVDRYIDWIKTNTNSTSFCARFSQ